jgi:hypothetical protein
MLPQIIIHRIIHRKAKISKNSGKLLNKIETHKVNLDLGMVEFAGEYKNYSLYPHENKEHTKRILFNQFGTDSISDVLRGGIYSFKSVRMHVDSTSRGYLGVIFMLKGSGTLTHFLNKKDYSKLKYIDTKMISGECYLLNDQLPHSFETDEACAAFICNVKFKKDMIFQ